MADHMPLTMDQFQGCILGLACGDAHGAPHEGGILERLVWRVIGRTSEGRLRWTDDTQMAVDLAESLLQENGVHADAMAQRFASSYRWSRGYGPGAAKVLKRIRRGVPWEQASKSVYPGGSYGNGAAMRAPVLALYFAHDHDQLLEAAEISAKVTHAHPLGVEGAVAIALAAHALLWQLPTPRIAPTVATACSQLDLAQRLKVVADWIAAETTPTPREVVARLGNGITAATSCPTAIYIALRHLNRPFNSMLQFVIACGGDVDTIGAMAGSLWGIANGPAELPSENIEGQDDLLNLAGRLFERRLQLG